MKGRLAAAAIAAVGATLWVVASPASATHVAAAAANGAWTRYHHDDGHTGYDPSAPGAITAKTGWTSPTLDGTVYGEPLVYNGFVYVGTLSGTVYALDQATGAVAWSRFVDPPQPVLSGQCGNVNPLGILGTPVIDAVGNRIYVSEISSNDDLFHVYGIDLSTSNIVYNYAIPNSIGTGFNWTIQQQRGALNISADRSHVFVPFGGRDGDCGPYHGWVVGVPLNAGGPLEVWESPSTAEGVWSAGGIVVDDVTGDVMFETGNAIPCSGASLSDSVIHTDGFLGATTYFQPVDWESNWCGPDLDLGSTSPVIINPNLIFTAGKYGQGFLLDPNNLGGTGHQLFPAQSPYTGADVCAGSHSDATFGSFAYAAPRVYLECQGRGLVSLTVNTAAPSFSLCDSTCTAPGTWRAATSMTFGPPIVAGGIVWVVDINGSGLYGFDASTGTQVYHGGSFSVHHFSTPSEAGGQVFVSSDTVVREFDMVQGCSSVALNANPTSPQALGTLVTLSAVASGCPDASPLYQFWMAAPGGSWQIVQPYSTTSTFAWHTAAPAGTYSLSVWVRDAMSNGAFANNSGRWDAYASSQLTLNPQQCSSVTLASSPNGTATSGTTVTLTGAAAGCPSPLYQFWIAAPGGSWQVVQPYSASATYSWHTNGSPAGAYSLSVWTRDASVPGAFGNADGRWDAYASATYSLTSTACSSAALSAAPSGSAAAGTTVTLTATATGCPNPLFQFWIAAPGGGWQIVQPYSSIPTYTWLTTPGAGGGYSLSVWVRDASSAGLSGNSTGRWDAYASGHYTLTVSPCSSVSLASSPPGATTAGTTVTFTASASGCPNPLYQFWTAAPGGGWQVVQPYSSAATFMWMTTTATAKGTYSVSVWVRDASSNGVSSNASGGWDAYASGHYTLS